MACPCSQTCGRKADCGLPASDWSTDFGCVIPVSLVFCRDAPIEHIAFLFKLCSGWNNGHSWRFRLRKNCHFTSSVQILQQRYHCVCWLWRTWKRGLSLKENLKASSHTYYVSQMAEVLMEVKATNLSDYQMLILLCSSLSLRWTSVIVKNLS